MICPESPNYIPGMFPFSLSEVFNETGRKPRKCIDGIELEQQLIPLASAASLSRGPMVIAGLHRTLKESDKQVNIVWRFLLPEQ